MTDTDGTQIPAASIAEDPLDDLSRIAVKYADSDKETVRALDFHTIPCPCCTQ